MTDRRQFLWNCSALTLTVSLAPAACLPSLRPVIELTLDQISLAAFSAHVGTGFKLVQNSGATVSLKLVEAKLTPPLRSLAHGAEDARNEKFSLLFTGPKEPAQAQDTYFFEHAGIGRFAMFIVPVRFGDSNRAWYQAIFNRPAPETST
jgi:hypothetical protein